MPSFRGGADGGRNSKQDVLGGKDTWSKKLLNILRTYSGSFLLIPTHSMRENFNPPSNSDEFQLQLEL